MVAMIVMVVGESLFFVFSWHVVCWLAQQAPPLLFRSLSTSESNLDASGAQLTCCTKREREAKLRGKEERRSVSRKCGRFVFFIDMAGARACLFFLLV